MNLNYELIFGILCIILGIIGIHCYTSSKYNVQCGPLSTFTQSTYDYRRKEILYISLSILVIGIVQLLLKLLVRK